MKVWAVYASGIERSEPVRYYESRASAIAYRDRCNAHEAKKPDFPNIGDPDAVWEKGEARFRRWEKRHPAKEYTQHTFEVHEVKVIGTTAERSKERGDE